MQDEEDPVFKALRDGIIEIVSRSMPKRQPKQQQKRQQQHSFVHCIESPSHASSMYKYSSL